MSRKQLIVTIAACLSTYALAMPHRASAFSSKRANATVQTLNCGSLHGSSSKGNASTGGHGSGRGQGNGHGHGSGHGQGNGQGHGSDHGKGGGQGKGKGQGGASPKYSPQSG